MRLNKDWLEYVDNDKIKVWSPFDIFEKGIEYTLDEKLVYIKHLMEYNSKCDIICKEYNSNKKLSYKEWSDLHNIIDNTRRWRYIRYKIQAYYGIEPHRIDPRSVLLDRIKTNIRIILDSSKKAETDERAVLLRYDLLTEIHIYSEAFKFDKSEMINLLSAQGDEPELKWLCTMLSLAPRLSYKFLFEVLLSFGTKLFHHYLDKRENFEIRYEKDIDGYISED